MSAAGTGCTWSGWWSCLGPPSALGAPTDDDSSGSGGDDGSTLRTGGDGAGSDLGESSWAEVVTVVVDVAAAAATVQCAVLH